MNETQIRQIATDVYNKLGTQWGVGKVPNHIHNGLDTNRITYTDILGIPTIAGTGAPALIAKKGTIYIRSDGSSTSTRLYINTLGTNVWTAITTAT